MLQKESAACVYDADKSVHSLPRVKTLSRLATFNLRLKRIRERSRGSSSEKSESEGDLSLVKEKLSSSR